MFEKNKEIELGDVAKDKISGFEGVVVAVTTWLHACTRITLQPKDVQEKTGQPVDNFTFDMPQLEMVLKGGYEQPEKEPENTEGKKTGGPSIAPVRSSDPI